MTDHADNKSEKSLKEALMPPLPFARHIIGENVDPLPDDITLDGALKRMAEMQKFCDEIDRQMDEVFRVTGWSRKQIEGYLSNPDNFSDDEWKNLNQERQKLMESIMTPEEIQKEREKAQAQPKALQELPHDPQLDKERRKKSIGARRNWLPMR